MALKREQKKVKLTYNKPAHDVQAVLTGLSPCILEGDIPLLCATRNQVVSMTLGIWIQAIAASRHHRALVSSAVKLGRGV